MAESSVFWFSANWLFSAVGVAECAFEAHAAAMTVGQFFFYTPSINSLNLRFTEDCSVARKNL